MRIALGYGRKSVVRRKSDEISVEKQRLAIERLAVDRGWQLEWYEDAEGHRSGRYESTRPGYKRLLARIDQGDAAAVIVYDLDRAARSLISIDKLVKLCKQKGAVLIAIRQGIDTSRAPRLGADDVFFIQVLGGVGEHEAAKASERMQETAAYYRDELLSPWGMWPFGMSRTGEGRDARFTPHEKHGPTVRTLLSWYASGLSYDAVAGKANDRQMRHEGRAQGPRGPRLPQRFSREAIRSIVGNVLFYAGYTVTGRRTRSKDNRIVLAGEGTYLERYARAMSASRSPAVEPLIDEPTACSVIERRFRNQMAGRTPVDWVALLSPLAYWREKKLRADVSHGLHYYRTRSTVGPYINGDQADAEIVQRLSGIAFPPEMRALIRASVAERIGDDKKRKAAADVETFQHQMEVLMDLLLSGQVQREHYNRRYTELERALRDARMELAREDDVDKLMAHLSDLGSAITAMRAVNRKRALGHLFEKVEFDDAGAFHRLYLKAWAKTAWGEIVFAYRLHAEQPVQAKGAPGERLAQQWPENLAWLIARAA